MRTFKHLSLEEREKLFAWKEKGLSLRKIAKLLKRNVGSVSRELKRHTKYGKQYIPCLAQKRANRWEQNQWYKAPLKEPLIFLYVRTHLRNHHWSPETISGRLPIDHPGYTIDDETIYRYVYGKKQRRMKLWEHLVLHRRKRMKKNGRKVQAYGRLSEAISIKERPSFITARVRPGDWETDNMEGKRSDATSISATVDRMTRITRLWKLANHTAESKAEALIVQMKRENPMLRGSITCDRGPENSNHADITDMHHMPVYACDPYHSWEKGTVENTIGRLRRFIPKGRSVDGISQKKLDRIEKTMNNTPRKVLGYLTQNEYLERILVASHTA